MLVWLAVCLLAGVAEAAEPHRSDVDSNANPTFCMKSWTTSECTISSIAIFGGLLLLVILIVGSWRLRICLRERKVNKVLQDPEGPGYHGDAPSARKYASGPETFKAPARPSSMISVLRRSEMRQTQPRSQDSPCSTRTLLVAQSPASSSAAQTEGNKSSFAFHMPLRAMSTSQIRSSCQLPGQPPTSLPRTAVSASQQRPPFCGSTNFQSAWTPEALYTHRQSTNEVQPATARTTSQPSTAQAFSQRTCTGSQIDYLLPKPAGYHVNQPCLSMRPAKPASSQYSSASTHSSLLSGTSASYSVSTPSPEPIFQIPASPAVQRVRAKSMGNEFSTERNQWRVTNHSTPIRQQIAPPPLPPIQTSGIGVQPRLMQQAGLVTHAHPREMLSRSAQRRRAQSSSALTPSPDDAARIGPSWHRSKMRHLR